MSNRAVFIVFLAVGCVQAAAADYTVQGPEKKDGFDSYVVTSDYQEGPTELFVLLPDALDKATPCKVLYILPVDIRRGEGRLESGITEARRLDLANKYGVICVEPLFTRMPWIADNPDDPSVRHESYITDVVVPFIDKTYLTVARPEGRLLVGFSKAGIGAITLLLRHPDVFGRAGCWDAPLMTDRNRSEFYGSSDNFMKNYHIPALLGDSADMLRGKPARIAIAGYGAFQKDTDAAHGLMDELAVPHYFDNSVERQHEWRSGWLGPMVEVLMAADMVKDQPAEPREN